MFCVICASSASAKHFCLSCSSKHMLCVSGRKMKRFGGLKVMGLSPSLMFQSPLSLLADVQSMSSLPCMSAIRELQLSPQMISILESIEPQVVYSGYDNSQPEVPNLLLNSLNRLCERQLLWIVRWSKSLPGNTVKPCVHQGVFACGRRVLLIVFNCNATLLKKVIS